MNPWIIAIERLNLDREGLYEALFTLGNGYFGTRGAMLESSGSKAHYPGTYIAGVYNKLETLIAGRKVSNEDFVNCPNWLYLNYKLDGGAWFDRQRVKILSYRRQLNLQRGLLISQLRWQDEKGRITEIVSRRIVSMAAPHFGAMRCLIRPRNYDGVITFRSGLDGSVVNAGVERYRQLNSKHLEPLKTGPFGEDGVFLLMRTNQSKIQIAETQRTQILRGDQPVSLARRTIVQGREKVFQEFSLPVAQGEEIAVEKLVSLYTSRDPGVTDPLASAQEALQPVQRFQELYVPHTAAWRALWKRLDIQVEGDPELQRLLRFATFHLFQTASSHNDENDAALPARGLHGEAYRGHIFWDGMFTLPFYALRAPEICRAMMMYRYRRLNPAREYARQHGYEGAMYPWQSGSSGHEETQTLHLNPLSKEWGDDYSSLQRHVSIAVALNLLRYYRLSKDQEFMDRYGGEMLLEIARFWSSIAVFNERRKRYEIRGVMGPDEFHEKLPGAEAGGLPNNAYTNVLAVFVLTQALELLQSMPGEEATALRAKLNLTSDELNRWEHVTRAMYVPMNPDGLLHQFEGFLELEELDWDEYRGKYDDIHRLDRILKAEGRSPDAYQVSKQADTLMIFYLLTPEQIRALFDRLGYALPEDALRVNYDYYARRTSHGSTLSYVVHGYLAKQLGREEEAWDFFQKALRADFDDVQGGTTAEGIHVGAMGGAMDVFTRCYAGLKVLDDRLAFSPSLPPHVSRLRCQFFHNHRWIRVEISDRHLKIFIEARRLQTREPAPLPVEIRGTIHPVPVGKSMVFSL